MADPVSLAGNSTPLLPKDISGAFGPHPETDAERMQRIQLQVCMENRALCLETARNKAASLKRLETGRRTVGPSPSYLLEGVFYTPDRLPPSLAAVKEAAKAVFPIVRKKDGEEETPKASTVCISQDGKFATMPHVIYHFTDVIPGSLLPADGFLDDSYLKTDGELIPIKEEYVITKLPEESVPLRIRNKEWVFHIRGIPWGSSGRPEPVVVLQFSQAASCPAIRPAKSLPEPGEQVFTISFPNTRYREGVIRISWDRVIPIHSGDGIKRVSWGRVIRITDQGEIVTTARVASGSSGGALVNSEGELVGLIAKGDDKESTATLSTQLFSDRADKSIDR